MFACSSGWVRMLAQVTENGSLIIIIIIILYEGRSENIWTWADISANIRFQIVQNIVAYCSLRTA